MLRMWDWGCLNWDPPSSFCWPANEDGDLSIFLKMSTGRFFGARHAFFGKGEASLQRLSMSFRRASRDGEVVF